MGAMVAHLASDEYTGRRIGTRGGRAAATWLAGQLEQAEARVALDGFAVTGAVREVYATPKLSFADGGEPVDLVFRQGFCEHLASADLPSPRTGGLAMLGQPEVAGAWVVEDAWAVERVAVAEAKGAIGILVPRGTDAAGWMPKMIAGPAAGNLPILAVRTDIHKRMRAAVGRATVTASVPLHTVDANGVNVLGTFRAATAGTPAVLLTAHFDGVGDDPDGTRFPAACDNASGVVAIMEAARFLHAVLPPDVGLEVALLDGEEAGAKGSAHHAPSVGPGTFVINLDGAAQLSGAAHVQAGGPAEPLLAALDQAGRQAGVALKAAAMPSDNRRYAAAGLAAVGIGMGMPGYQTPAETPDRVSGGTLLAACRLVILSARGLISSLIGDQR